MAERAGRRSRSGRKESNKAKEVPVEAKQPKDPLKINFGLEKERAEYIQKKLDDILENIGSSYGQKMAEELVRRLQKTITDFHAEVEGMLSKLADIEDDRRKESEKEPEKEDSAAFENMSEVERRLEMKERQKGTAKAEPKEPEKPNRKSRKR